MKPLFGLILLSAFIGPLGTTPTRADVTIGAHGTCGLNCTVYGIDIFGKIEESTLKDFLKAVADPRIKGRRAPRHDVLELTWWLAKRGY